MEENLYIIHTYGWSFKKIGMVPEKIKYLFRYNTGGRGHFWFIIPKNSIPNMLHYEAIPCNTWTQFYNWLQKFYSETYFSNTQNVLYIKEQFVGRFIGRGGWRIKTLEKYLGNIIIIPVTHIDSFINIKIDSPIIKQIHNRFPYESIFSEIKSKIREAYIWDNNYLSEKASDLISEYVQNNILNIKQTAIFDKLLDIFPYINNDDDIKWFLTLESIPKSMHSLLLSIKKYHEYYKIEYRIIIIGVCASLSKIISNPTLGDIPNVEIDINKSNKIIKYPINFDEFIFLQKSEND